VLSTSCHHTRDSACEASLSLSYCSCVFDLESNCCNSATDAENKQSLVLQFFSPLDTTACSSKHAYLIFTSAFRRHLHDYDTGCCTIRWQIRSISASNPTSHRHRKSRVSELNAHHHHPRAHHTSLRPPCCHSGP
jgi:hypothetical protein